MWGIFVVKGNERFPNFFPVALYASYEQALKEIEALPKDLNYDLLQLPLNRSFAYYHKKSGKLVGMDGIYHEHFHFQASNEEE